jgi:predicted DCC family thiol-disulfide oxidoreductase YuxK
MAHTIRTEPMVHPILLYDGVCGLCNRMVQFILRRDPAGWFRFASLQSALAGRVLARHGMDARDLDTVYVVANYEMVDEFLLERSEAVIFILRHLGAAELCVAGQPGAAVPTEAASTSTSTSRPGASFWGLTGSLLQAVPQRLRDWGYGVVARRRYRIFGRYDACPLPTDETRSRFLDL